MSIKKGDKRILSESGEKVTVTHVSAISIGWREKGQITTTHTSRSRFLEISRKELVRANIQLKTKIAKVMKSIGGIGTFNKIINAMRKSSKVEVSVSRVRKTLVALVGSGNLHYFENSDTYMISGEQA